MTLNRYEFDDVVLRVYIAETASWTDLSADVLWAAGVKGSRGIQSNKITERVGNVGQLTFKLKGARYVPEAYTSYPSTPLFQYWHSGQAVQLSFEYGGMHVNKWYGYIVDIRPVEYTVSNSATPVVEVVCQDYMGKINDEILPLMTVEVNKPIQEAAEILMFKMPERPKQIQLDNGLYTYTAVFDNMSGETTALSELNKLASSEWGYVYVKGGGEWGEILVVESQEYRTRAYRQFNYPSTGGTALLPTYPTDTSSCLLINGSGDRLLINSAGDHLLLYGGTLTPAVINGTDVNISSPPTISYGKDVYNYFKFIGYPRKIDAAGTTVLWTMQEPLLVPAGESKTGIRGKYRDPVSGSKQVYGINMITPVASTDYKAYANANGSGTDLTADLTVGAEFGSGEVEFTISNGGLSNAYTGGTAILFQVRGQAVYLYDTIELVYSNSTSITRYGKKPLVFDMRYQEDVEAIRTALLKFYTNVSVPAYSIDSLTMLANKDEGNMLMFMALEIGDKVGVDIGSLLSTVGVVGLSASIGYNNYFINGYEFEVFGKRIVRWTPTLINALLVNMD